MSQPQFRLRARGANIFVPNEAPQLTGIAINALVWNTGEPSAIVEWTLTVTPPSGRPVVAYASAMPETLDLGSTKIHGRDSLAEACETTLVDKTPRAGVLLFYVELAKDTVVQSDTSLDLTLADIYDNHTSFQQRIADWFNPKKKLPSTPTGSSSRH